MIAHTCRIRDILLLLFWCWPARAVCWPLQSGSMQHTIVDDNVEAAPLYRCNGKAGQPIVRPHESHVLHMEWEPTWMERQQKQQTQSNTVPASGSLDTNINSEKMNLASFSCSTHLTYITKISSMDVTHYWPFAREYSIWNSAVTALQFWMEDLKPHILSDAIERVYIAFFCSNSAQQLRNISEEILFSYFMTSLNDAYEWELTQEDEGYESGSESLNIPTPLCRTPWLYHISVSEYLSFNPATPFTTVHPHWTHSPQWHRGNSSVHHSLTFSSDKSPSTDSSQLHAKAEQSSHVQQNMVYHCTDDSFQDATSEEEEDIPTAPLDDDIWLEDPVTDRQVCIHEQSWPHDQCPYPCPYHLNQLHSTQKMHKHHIMRWWISVTSLISKIWWQLPAMKTSLIWMMFWTLNMKISLDKLLYSSNFLHMKQDGYVYEHW